MTIARIVTASWTKGLLWAIGILLLIVAALAAALVVQGARHDAKVAGLDRDLAGQTQLAEQRASRIGELTRANASTKDANDQLAKMLEDEVRAGQNTAKLLADARQQRDTARSERDAAQTALRNAREVIYATDPTCADWAARPVCGAISDSLSDQWNQARQLPARR